MTKLIADRITKQYQNKIAVDTLSLSLDPGLYGLLGANGAGKTTLLRMLAGILQPDRGEIFLGKYTLLYRNRVLLHVKTDRAAAEYEV